MVNNNSAAERLEKNICEVNEKLEKIKSLVQVYTFIDTNSVTWADVGDINKVNELLYEVVSFLSGESWY